MDDSTQIKVEISPETLLRLLKNKQMFPSEMRYLDDKTKLIVRQFCLNACLSKEI